jgi:PhoH-like ATPase
VENKSLFPKHTDKSEKGSTLKKNFVFDTNVLLHDPRALFHFADNNVVVPITVIEELDTFKKHANQLGRNARQASRYIDGFRLQGNLSGEGVEMETGGNLRVLYASREVMASPELDNRDSPDARILGVGLMLKRQEPDLPVVMISKDTNVRIRANAIGLRAEDFEQSVIPIDELYTGYSEWFVSGECVDRLFDERSMDVDELRESILLPENNYAPDPESSFGPMLFANQFLVLKDAQNDRHNAVVRVEPHGEVVKTLSKRSKENVWGIRGRNREQGFALDLLLDERIKLVTLVGKAGTGKTLLAIAAGLQSVVEEQAYSKLLISRPILPLGRDLGYLPGSMEEKLMPWMQPIFDNVDFLMGISGEEHKRRRGYEELMDMDLLQIEPLTYIRGRSIPKQFMLVDEAQNLTAHELKTIISRVGENTKIVLTGDPYQIDHPYLDASNNGLVHVVNKMRGQGIAAHMTLQKGERSELAELASDLL